MGFPFATAYYKKTQVCAYTSRSKGYNINGSFNNPSYCAEYRLYRSLCQICPDAIKNKGRKLLVLVDTNGRSSKPCLNCKTFYSRVLPLCKIKFKFNDKYYISSPSNITGSIYSKGVNNMNIKPKKK